MKNITVREYAKLTTAEIENSLDEAQVSTVAFDYLCKLNASYKQNGASLLQKESQTWLKLDNYVGIIETPCGTQIEILPKIVQSKVESIEVTRAIFIRMLCVALDLSARETGVANIERFKSPLIEWVIGQFLINLIFLVKQGLRFDYVRVSAEKPYLKGQLHCTKQAQQLPHRLHLFHIRHDIFSENRPEHRLLRLALDVCIANTKDSENWRLARNLLSLFDTIPPSIHIKKDFRMWQSGRLMAYYQEIKRWCELILGNEMPMAVSGNWRGISLLFPMEKLFEVYVARKLKSALPSHAVLHTQKSSRYLCTYQNALQQQSFFQLRPDMILEINGKQIILDTKWKRLSSCEQTKQFGLSQSDFYQMFAYGHKYLNGDGNIILIYPKTDDFPELDGFFSFSSTLNLKIMSYDLQQDKLIGIEQLIDTSLSELVESVV